MNIRKKHWKKALKDSLEKWKEHWIIRKEMSRNEKENEVLTKRISERLKEFSLNELLKYVEKSTKWSYESKKMKKVIWKITKTPVEMEQKQLEINSESRTRKNFQKVNEVAPKWKEHAKFEKALKWFKKLNFQKKGFVNWKKITKFGNEASRFRNRSAN